VSQASLSCILTPQEPFAALAPLVLYIQTLLDLTQISSYAILDAQFLKKELKLKYQIFGTGAEFFVAGMKAQ
jgi:hypothetical protein